MDHNGETYVYTYYALNRIVSETNPLDGTKTFHYDKDSQIVGVNDRNDRNVTYVYNNVGNIRYYTKDNSQSFAELKYDVWGAVTGPSKLVTNDNGNFAAAVFTGHPYNMVLDIDFAEARFYDADHLACICYSNRKPLSNYLYLNINIISMKDIGERSSKMNIMSSQGPSQQIVGIITK